ncbi:MAG: DUF2905 domain-containing protein [Balneolales bacterium]
MARWIILSGIILVITGIVLHLAPWLFNWFGRLPGDIRIERGRSYIFIPISSMIIVSLLLTILVNIARRIME